MTARGLVKVFLFCIMAQIVEASSEVQASSGGTHCGEAEQSRARVTPEGLCQLSPHSCPAPLIRQLTAGYHRKTEGLGVFQSHKQSGKYNSRPSVFSAAIKDANIARQLINIISHPVFSRKHLEALLLFSVKNKETAWQMLALDQVGFT